MSPRKINQTSVMLLNKVFHLSEKEQNILALFNLQTLNLSNQRTISEMPIKKASSEEQVYS